MSSQEQSDKKLRSSIDESHGVHTVAGEMKKLERRLAASNTEKRRLQSELRNLKQQLHRSQRMETLGRLTGGIAHDFNNIITSIIGQTHLSKAALDPSKPIFTALTEIENAAKGAAKLTRQILTFSRKEQTSPVSLNINELIGSYKSMLKRIIGENIQLEILLEKNLGCVKADPSQIDQTILNLVINARDAMPNGGSVIISTQNDQISEPRDATLGYLRPGKYVRLTVKDGGCGMDAATLKNIFNPFFTTKSVDQGTGLGLSIVSGIILQHNGAIDVESVKDKGSSFSVYIPWFN